MTLLQILHMATYRVEPRQITTITTKISNFGGWNEASNLLLRCFYVELHTDYDELLQNDFLGSPHYADLRTVDYKYIELHRVFSLVHDMQI